MDTPTNAPPAESATPTPAPAPAKPSNDLKKLSSERSDEIAIALVRYKYKKKGLHFGGRAWEEWIRSKAKSMGIGTEEFTRFANEIIVPAVLESHVKMELRGFPLNKGIAGSYARRMLFSEYSFDLGRIEADIKRCSSPGFFITEDEMRSMFVYEYFPYLTEKVSKANKCTVSVKSEPVYTLSIMLSWW